MSEATILALINNLPALVTAIGSVIGACAAVWALVVSRNNGKKVDASAAQITEAAVKVAEVKQAADETLIVAKQAKAKTVQLEEQTHKMLAHGRTDAFTLGEIQGMQKGVEQERQRASNFGEMPPT